MAEETLSSAAELLVERSLVDAYIEIQGNESSRSEKCIVNNSNDIIDTDKLDEFHCKAEEAGIFVHKPDSTHGTKLVSSNESPHDTYDAKNKSSKMEEKRDEYLVTNSDYEASVESEDTDELISIKQDVILESNVEDGSRNRFEGTQSSYY